MLRIIVDWEDEMRMRMRMGMGMGIGGYKIPAPLAVLAKGQDTLKLLIRRDLLSDHLS